MGLLFPFSLCIISPPVIVTLYVEGHGWFEVTRSRHPAALPAHPNVLAVLETSGLVSSSTGHGAGWDRTGTSRDGWAGRRDFLGARDG